MSNTSAIASELASALVQDIHVEITEKVKEEVNNTLSTIDIPQLVQHTAEQLANSLVSLLRDQITSEVKSKTSLVDIFKIAEDTAVSQSDAMVNDIKDQVSKQVTADVMRKLSSIDIERLVGIHVDQVVTSRIKETVFPVGSINAKALDVSELIISGDNILGGIVKKFGSTGIQDSATTCQVTILDNATVIENKLVTSSAEIKGDLTVDGNLILTGEIPTDSPFYRDLVEHSAGLLKLSMDGQFFLTYADKVFEQIKEKGLDLNKLTLDGREILKGNQLGGSITDTNIQKLGHLRELTVTGDTIMADTAYIGKKRVGINTTEPAGALAVWDEECEVVVRKYRKDVPILGTIRPQQLVLSSNNKNNLVLETDGSVTIAKLTVGAVEMSSASEQPKHDAPKGIILFNELPDIGKPLGWVSLGGAVWVPFSMIG